MKIVLHILFRVGIGLGLMIMGLALFGLVSHYPMPFLGLLVLIAAYLLGMCIDNKD